MQRYLARVISARTAPAGALVEPLVENPPASPLGEHAQLPEVAWMIERDGRFVHVLAADAEDLEVMRGSALLTVLDGELANEALEDLPGVTLASNGTYAPELLLDPDHLAQLHQMFGGKVYLAAAPRRGRLLVGGVAGGIEGMRAFVARARREHDEALLAERISPVAILVRDGVPTSAIGDLQLAALAHAMAQR